MSWAEKIISEIQLLVQQGGPVLWVMIGLSVILYGLIYSTWRGLRALKSELAQLVSERIDAGDVRAVECDIAIFEMSRFAWVKRRLPMIAVLVAAAPLAGLLGTVFGMFVTFNGMASDRVSQPIDGISVGISAAMVTTQVGLFMAIPGAVFLALLRSQVSHLQSGLEQKMYREMVRVKGGEA